RLRLLPDLQAGERVLVIELGNVCGTHTGTLAVGVAAPAHHPTHQPTTRKRDENKIERGTPYGMPLSWVYARRCPTLPRRLQRSTIGADGLSFRVRNVTGRFPTAMTAVTPYPLITTHNRADVAFDWCGDVLRIV